MELVHYTNNIALLSILQKKELWATKYTHLNDKNELVHLKTLFQEENNAYFKKKMIASNLKDHLVKYEQCVNKIFSKYFDNLSKNIFVVSFSKNSDKFNMWSYFASNNGYNIKFNYDVLLKQLGINNFNGDYSPTNNNISDFDKIVIPNSSLDNDNMPHREVLHGEVIYTEDEKRTFIKELLYSYYTSDNEYNDEEFSSYDHLEFIIKSLLYKSYFFKQQGFLAEEEYRIVFIIKETFPEVEKLIHYRTNDSENIPYLRININSEKVFDQLNVGPWIEKIRMKNNLQLFLKHNINYPIDVNISEMTVKL